MLGGSDLAGMIKIPQSLGRMGGMIAPAPAPKDKGPAKYSDYIKQEKLRKFKRLPRLVGKRTPQKFTCPNCNQEKMS